MLQIPSFLRNMAEKPIQLPLEKFQNMNSMIYWLSHLFFVLTVTATTEKSSSEAEKGNSTFIVDQVSTYLSLSLK